MTSHAATPAGRPFTRDGCDEQPAHVTGRDFSTAPHPFPVMIVPARLPDGTRP